MSKIESNIGLSFFENNLCKEDGFKDGFKDGCKTFLLKIKTKIIGKRLNFSQPLQKKFYYFGVSTIMDFY